MDRLTIDALANTGSDHIKFLNIIGSLHKEKGTVSITYNANTEFIFTFDSNIAALAYITKNQESLSILFSGYKLITINHSADVFKDMSEVYAHNEEITTSTFSVSIHLGISEYLLHSKSNSIKRSTVISPEIMAVFACTTAQEYEQCIARLKINTVYLFSSQSSVVYIEKHDIWIDVSQLDLPKYINTNVCMGYVYDIGTEYTKEIIESFGECIKQLIGDDYIARIENTKSTRLDRYLFHRNELISDSAQKEKQQNDFNDITALYPNNTSISMDALYIKSIIDDKCYAIIGLTQITNKGWVMNWQSSLNKSIFNDITSIVATRYTYMSNPNKEHISNKVLRIIWQDDPTLPMKSILDNRIKEDNILMVILIKGGKYNLLPLLKEFGIDENHPSVLPLSKVNTTWVNTKRQQRVSAENSLKPYSVFKTMYESVSTELITLTKPRAPIVICPNTPRIARNTFDYINYLNNIICLYRKDLLVAYPELKSNINVLFIKETKSVEKVLARVPNTLRLTEYLINMRKLWDKIGIPKHLQTSWDICATFNKHSHANWEMPTEALHSMHKVYGQKYERFALAIEEYRYINSFNDTHIDRPVANEHHPLVISFFTEYPLFRTYPHNLHIEYLQEYFKCARPLR